MLIGLIHDIEIPTIGVIPGPGAHTGLALVCDLTLCSDNAIMIDPHFDLGLVPGDGIHSAFIELVAWRETSLTDDPDRTLREAFEECHIR